MCTGFTPAKRKRSQDSGKLDPELKAKLEGWYLAWENSGVFTPIEKLSMWFKILRENGVSY